MVRLPSFFITTRSFLSPSYGPNPKVSHATSGRLETAGNKGLTVLHTWLRQVHAGQEELVQRPKATAGVRKWSWQQFKCLKVHGEEVGMMGPPVIPALRLKQEDCHRF